MQLIQIKSDGLAANSFLVMDGREAAVIDPRRDADIYLETAHRAGHRITHIFETHRNEDYVTGSAELSRRCGATIRHGKWLDFDYGTPVGDGEEFTVGDLRLRILHTPGHTDESISIALYDTATGEDAVGVFTGDALFIGDVGRTDFYPDRAEEVAGLLYESLHEKILPLGDQAVLYPAHGAGSVCGSGMADREVSTLGYERKNNPRLQLGRDEFIRAKRGENHYVPPYFKEMERRNLEGRQELPVSRPPTPITATEFSAAMDGGLQAVDIRSPEAFAGAFVPGSLAIPCSMLPAFAGWFLSYDAPIGLIGPEDGHDGIRTAVTHLHRLGFDQVSCVLSGGVHAWETSGRAYDRIPALYAKHLQARIDGEEDFTLLDVRSIDEWETGHLPGATHIYLGHLPDQLPKVPKDKPVVTFCGSGRRAVIAASLLKRNGYERVEDALGSMSACREVGCRIHEPQAS